MPRCLTRYDDFVKKEWKRSGPKSSSGSLVVPRATELVTAPEIARRIGLSGPRVHALRDEGELPEPLGRIGGIHVWEWAVVEPKLRATRSLAPKRRGPKPQARPDSGE